VDCKIWPQQTGNITLSFGIHAQHILIYWTARHGSPVCLLTNRRTELLVVKVLTSASARSISHHTVACWHPKFGHPWGYRLGWCTIGTIIHFWIFDS